MQKITLLATIVCSSMLLLCVSAVPNPFGWKLEPEFQSLEKEERNHIIEHKRNIDTYQGELRRLEKELVGKPTDAGLLTDKEYYLDVLAAEEGMLACIKNKIIRGEQVEWQDISDYVPNFKYIRSLYKKINLINAIEAGETEGSATQLKQQIESELEARRNFRDSLKTGELPELLNHKKNTDVETN